MRETGSYEPLVFKFYNNKIYTRKGIIYNGVVANYIATAQLSIKKPCWMLKICNFFFMMVIMQICI